MWRYSAMLKVCRDLRSRGWKTGGRSQASTVQRSWARGGYCRLKMPKCQTRDATRASLLTWRDRLTASMTSACTVWNRNCFLCFHNDQRNHLCVHLPPFLSSSVPPSIIGQLQFPENVSVVMRNPVALICEASGIPLPTISWLKDGQPIKTTSSARILSGLFLFDFLWLFELLVLIFYFPARFQRFQQLQCAANNNIMERLRPRPNAEASSVKNQQKNSSKLCFYSHLKICWVLRGENEFGSKRMLLMWKVWNGNCNKVSTES